MQRHIKGFFLGLFWICASLPVQAQDMAPFSQVGVRIHGSRNVNRALLHEYWTPGVGVEVSMATPFHVGFLEFGGAIHRYNSRVDDTPGFGALWLYGGWGMKTTVFRPLQLQSSARLGNYRMSFDGAEARFAGTSSESELVLSVGIHAAYTVNDLLSVYASVDRLSIFTFSRISLWYAAVGMSLNVQWGSLQKFLR